MHERLMRHGRVFGQFDVKYVGTDYFAFYHKPCQDRKTVNGGHCLPTRLLLDNDGRIIFHLKCLDCGFEDVLKTRFEMWATEQERHCERRILLEKKLVQAARLAHASTKRS